MTDPASLRRKLLASDDIELAVPAGEGAHAFGEGERLVLNRLAEERLGVKPVAQVVVGEERVVIPAPITVDVAHVALAAFAVTGVADIRAGRVPLFQLRVRASQQSAERLAAPSGERQFVR